MHAHPSRRLTQRSARRRYRSKQQEQVQQSPHEQTSSRRYSQIGYRTRQNSRKNLQGKKGRPNHRVRCADGYALKREHLPATKARSCRKRLIRLPPMRCLRANCEQIAAQFRNYSKPYRPQFVRTGQSESHRQENRQFVRLHVCARRGSSST